MRIEAQEVAKDLQVQSQLAIDGKEQLGESLAAARDLREQLNRAVQQAGEDARAINEVRTSVEEQQRLIGRTANILRKTGYEVHMTTSLPTDILAVPGTVMINKKHLLVDVSILEGEAPLHDAVNRARATRNMINRHSSVRETILSDQTFTMIIVYDDENIPGDQYFTVPDNPFVSVIPISEFEEFLSSSSDALDVFD